MTNTNDKNEKITSAKIIAEQEQLKAKYEAEIKQAQEDNLTLQNTILKKDDEIFELQKTNEGLAKDRDEWKQSAHSARRVQQATKEHKEQADFKSEFIKLQQKKGWQWDESQGWVKA